MTYSDHRLFHGARSFGALACVLCSACSGTEPTAATGVFGDGVSMPASFGGATSSGNDRPGDRDAAPAATTVDGASGADGPAAVGAAQTGAGGSTASDATGTSGVGPESNGGAGGATSLIEAGGASSVVGADGNMVVEAAGGTNSSGGATVDNAGGNPSMTGGAAGSPAANGGTGGNVSMGGSPGTGGVSNLSPPPALTETVTVHVAGDSTAAIFDSSDPRVGWAAVLQQFFAAGVVVNDAAQSGRSSKSFIDEGFWDTLEAQIEPGDYLFIEFGHNDEKDEDPARYTDPTTTYRSYLQTYIDDARAKGGYPVLLTSIARRYFSGTTPNGTHGAYTEAVFAVGAETNVPVIDMESKTIAWLAALGPNDSIPMFAPDDQTHLSAAGALEVAELAVDGIREFSFPIEARLNR